MATYSRRERVTRTVEFTVPAAPPHGACWTEVAKAVSAAVKELRDAGRIGPHDDPQDDMIRIRPGDDEVVVSYETEGPA